MYLKSTSQKALNQKSGLEGLQIQSVSNDDAFAPFLKLAHLIELEGISPKVLDGHKILIQFN